MGKRHRACHQRARASTDWFRASDVSLPVHRVWLRRGVAAATLSATLVVLTSIVSTQAGATTVRILPGENLTEIAAAHGTSVSSLVAANGIRNPNLVVAGTTLVIPGNAGIVLTSASASGGGATVVVNLGDTLSAIAARYGTSVAALAAANGISNPNLVIAGSRLAVASASASTISAANASYSVPVSSGAVELPSCPATGASRPPWSTAVLPPLGVDLRGPGVVARGDVLVGVGVAVRRDLIDRCPGDRATGAGNRAVRADSTA